MTQQQDRPVDLKHYWRILLRRKTLVFLCLVVSLSGASIALRFTHSEYESDVTLMIEDPQPVSAELEQLMLIQPQKGYKADEERLARLAGRIRSRPFLERVIHLLRLNEDPDVVRMAQIQHRQHPEISVDEMAIRILVKNLQSRIRITAAGPSIYRISVADYEPENAQRLARWISELFVDLSNENVLERLRTAHDFGTEQLRIYQQQLRQSEEVLEQYKAANIGEQLTPSVVRADNLIVAEILLRRLNDDAAALRGRVKSDSLAMARAGAREASDEFLADPGIRSLATGLATAIKGDLLSRLAANSADIAEGALTGTGAVARLDLLRAVENLAAIHYPETSSELIPAVSRYVFTKLDLEARATALKLLNSAIVVFKRQAESIPGGEMELARLENEVEMNSRLLHSFRSQLVASDVTQAVEMTKLGQQIEIIDPAHLPLSPVRPDRLKILLSALVLGGLLGAGLAFASETMDPVLRTLDEFESVFPEPVLGTTPRLGRLIDRRAWIHRHAGAVVFVLLALATAALMILPST